MRSLFIGPVVVVGFVACQAAVSSEPPAAPPRPPAPLEGPAAPSRASDASVEPDAGGADASPGDAALADASAAPDASAQAEGPSACPEGMKLIDGDYCTKVEQTCTKSWWDDVNKKKVCENFSAPSRCVGEKERKRYCIDTYEYPNIEHARPEVMNNFYQAQVKCAALGKRMCTESEWTLACEGPEMKPYPYGYERDATKCNGDHQYDFPKMTKVARRDSAELERLWLGVPSGTQPECVSDYGVADMPGNADEVASNEHFSGFEDKYDNVTIGGPWYLGVRNQCRPRIYTHDEGFYYYYLSFRCCAEPDGKPTDPRAPRQVKRGWDFERVERIAGLTVEQAKARQPADFDRARKLGEQQLKDRQGKPADHRTWQPNQGRDKNFTREHERKQ